jgi:hypothetical protein
MLTPLHVDPISCRLCSIRDFPNLPFTVVVVGPNSGPGGPPGTQPDDQTQACLEILKASGSNVNTVGYVSTNYTRPNRPVSAVETDIEAYGNWSAAYRPSGIFFDETTSDSVNVTTYVAYANFARAHGLNTASSV